MELNEFEFEAKKYLSEFQEEINEVEVLIFEFSNPQKINDSKLELTRLIHSMKGTAGSYGFELLSLICHKIEDQLLTAVGQNVDTLIDSLLGLNDKLSEVLKYYKENDQNKLNEAKLRLLGKLLDKKTPKQQTNDELSPNMLHQKGSILICENSRFLLNTLATQASAFDVEISYAKDGYDALGRMLVERFDLVIISKHIPVIEALPLIKTITALRNTSGMQFVLITSSSDKPDLESKDTLYIQKDEHLFNNFKKILSAKFNPIKQKDNFFESKKTIMVIDDSMDIQNIVKLSLGKFENLTLIQCMNPLEAESKILAHQPDLILFDLQMPTINGDELYRQLKSKSLLKKSINVFLTALNNPQELLELNLLKPHKILKKPFAPKYLIQNLNELLK